MSAPEHVSVVVARVLRGMDPSGGDSQSCEQCGDLFGVNDKGAQDGHCPTCAADKRRAGKWHTPTLVSHVDQETCPLCGKRTQVDRDQPMQECDKCSARFRLDLQG